MTKHNIYPLDPVDLKKDHEICPQCDGTRVVDARDPDADPVECPSCGGEGQVWNGEEDLTFEDSCARFVNNAEMIMQGRMGV